MSDLQKTDSDKIYQIMLQGVRPSYQYGARRFVTFLQDHGMGLTYQALEAYMNDLDKVDNGKRLAAATYNIYRAAALDRVRTAIKQFEAGFSIGQKYELEQALKKIKPKKIASSKVSKDRLLTYEEVETFLHKCPDPVIKHIFEFLAFNGTRITETLNILLSDLTGRGDHFDVRLRGKGSKERIIHVDKDLVERIKKQFNGDVYLFQSPHNLTGELHNGDRDPRTYRREYVSMRIKRLARKLLNRNIAAHTLRHSWASHVIKKTGRVKAVQAQLGHSSASTTLNLYTHDSFEWKEQQGFFCPEK